MKTKLLCDFCGREGRRSELYAIVKCIPHGEMYGYRQKKFADICMKCWKKIKQIEGMIQIGGKR